MWLCEANSLVDPLFIQTFNKQQKFREDKEDKKLKTQSWTNWPNEMNQWTKNEKEKNFYGFGNGDNYIVQNVRAIKPAKTN